MGKNYVAEWMEDNGIEVGEEFEIVGLKYNPYYIKNTRMLIDKDGDPVSERLSEIISGNRDIKKLPPKPKFPEVGAKYWFIWSRDTIARNKWGNGAVDYLNFKAGNYFTSKEEAGANKDRIVAMLNDPTPFEGVGE